MPVEAMQEFSCTSPPDNTFHFTWAVNGSVERGQFENIVVGAEDRLTDGSLQSNLTFTAKSGANNTKIHCIVTHLSAEPSSFVSVNITVIIQGIHTYILSVRFMQYNTQDIKIMCSSK